MAPVFAGPPPILGAEGIFAPLPPIEYVVKDLDVAPGAPLLIAGFGYSGKTIAAQDLALAVASGTKVWGRFDVGRRGKVLHLDYEQGSHLTRLRYQRLARARGLAVEELRGWLSLWPMPHLRLDDAGAEEQLLRLFEGYDFAIIDSFRAACPTVEENSSANRLPMDMLTRVGERQGTMSAVIHHARKPGAGSSKSDRMSIRGNGALYDASGSALVFSAEKGRPVTVTHEKARISGRTHPDFGLWVEDVEVDGDPDAGLRVSYIEAPSGSGGTPDARVAALAEKVAAARAAGFQGSSQKLAEHLHARKADVLEAIRLLARGSQIGSGSGSPP